MRLPMGTTNGAEPRPVSRTKSVGDVRSQLLICSCRWCPAGARTAVHRAGI